MGFLDKYYDIKETTADYTFQQMPLGENVVRIKEAKEVTFKSGNGGIQINLVSDSNFYIVHRIVDNEYAEKNLNNLFGSFKIEGAERKDPAGWAGKKAVAVIKRGKEWNGQPQHQVSFFKGLPKDYVAPANENVTAAIAVAADDIPF